MSASAMVMLCVAIVTVWGGLAAAVVNIVRHPEEPEE
jgi:glycogen synthase